MYPRARVHGYSPKAAKPLGPGAAWGWSPAMRQTAGEYPADARRDAPTKPTKQVGYGPETGAEPGAKGRCPRGEGLTALERSTAADHAASGQG